MSPKEITLIPIKLGNKIIFINTKDVKYILASGNYAEIHVNNKKHIIRMSLTKLMSKFSNNNFTRIHRSSIINIVFLKEIISSNYGEVDVKMNDNKILAISQSYKKELFQKLNI